MSKPLVCVYSHLANRDYFGNINLIAHLNNLGFATALVTNSMPCRESKKNYIQWIIENEPDIVILPKIWDSRNIYEILSKKAGNYRPYLIAIPTEFGEYSNNPDQRISEKVQSVGTIDVQYTDAIFVISKQEKKAIISTSLGFDENNIHVTGNPRYDLFHPEYEQMSLGQNKLCEKLEIRLKDFKKIVTVATSFPKAIDFEKRSKKEFEDFITYYSKTGLMSVDVARQRLTDQFKMRRHFKDMIHKLAKKYKDILFIVKVHPDESDHYYHKALPKLKNVRIVKNMLSFDFLRISNFHIHYYCTTALEAMLLNIPTLHYQPSDIEDLSHKIRLGTTSIRAKNVDEISRCIKSLLNDELFIPEELAMQQTDILDFAFNEHIGKGAKNCAQLVMKISKSDNFNKRNLPYKMRSEQKLQDILMELHQYHTHNNLQPLSKRISLIERLKTHIKRLKTHIKRIYYFIRGTKLLLVDQQISSDYSMYSMDIEKVRKLIQAN
jgi:surface carbohydrate biosynthesis protein